MQIDEEPSRVLACPGQVSRVTVATKMESLCPNAEQVTEGLKSIWNRFISENSYPAPRSPPAYF